MKQVQRQQLQQKLSPQQIQLMRLLQLPVTDLGQAIKEEVERNPLLEATTPEEQPLPQSETSQTNWDEDPEDGDYEPNYAEYSEHDPNEVRREFVVSDAPTPAELLIQQLSLQKIDNRQLQIATEIIGSLDDSGYLVRDLDLIANDLAFRRGIDASPDEVAQALQIVQSLEPAGVGARSLQECLSLQLARTNDEDGSGINKVALDIIEHHFDDFAHHRYQSILSSLAIDQNRLDQAIDLIHSLNPKPANSESNADAAAYITPDIILTQHDGRLQFFLNDSQLPQLSLNPYYTDMLQEMEHQKGDRNTIQFLRARKNEAQGFIDLLQQRNETISRVMRYIIQHQKRFLITGDPDQLQPLRQREVAQATGLDISTVSRMANSKYLQTDFGTIPLKDCFSKGLATSNGEVSVETIKQRLASAVDAEDKRAPLSDDALARTLNEQGMHLARRTVAKYRELLGIPVARLRKIVTLLFLLSLTQVQAQMSYYDSIIAARLEVAPQSTPSPHTPAKRAVAEPKAGSTATHTSMPPKQLVESSTPHSTAATDTTTPSIWYNSFPRHRVNPMGKTQLDMLPDEINLQLVYDTTDFCFPVRNAKTSNYGWRWNRGHHGVDIRLQTGEPVHAAFSGTVRVASRMGGYGNCVVLRHPNGLETLYGHLSKINVKHGQQVAAGEVIGLGGSTGNSTGPHLHFECRFLYQTFDPEWILDFDNHSLRTRKLHLDKSYFGIKKPRAKESAEYKADKSFIQESKKRTKNRNLTINLKDF